MVKGGELPTTLQAAGRRTRTPLPPQQTGALRVSHRKPARPGPLWECPVHILQQAECQFCVPNVQRCDGHLLMQRPHCTAGSKQVSSTHPDYVLQRSFVCRQLSNSSSTGPADAGHPCEQAASVECVRRSCLPQWSVFLCACYLAARCHTWQLARGL